MRNIFFHDIFTKDTIKEVLAIVSFSILVAFTVNFLSPNGIAIFGQWDISKGVITAKNKGNVVVPEREIDDISVVIPIYKDHGALFVDARDASVFNNGHIKGAISIPINDYEHCIENFLEKYKTSERIITYCSGRECDESHILAENLFEEGYNNISVFIDGFEAWEENSLPIEHNK